MNAITAKYLNPLLVSIPIRRPIDIQKKREEFEWDQVNIYKQEAFLFLHKSEFIYDYA